MALSGYIKPDILSLTGVSGAVLADLGQHDLLKMVRTIFTLSFLLLCLAPARLHAQQPAFFSLEPADTLHKPRLWAAVGTGTAIYGTALVWMHRSWVSNAPSKHFHTINDFGDWNQMDKMGHWLLAYNQARWLNAGVRWAGVRPRTAAWLGFAGSQLMMGTLEMFDGYASRWGFSWSDVSFNLLGSGMFLAQEIGWSEQRIMMKVSAWPKNYSSEQIYPVSPAGSDASTTLQQRSDALYGTGLVSLLLKDYNASTVWISVNPRSFLSGNATWLPRWLNLAVGMGADNLFVGQGYEWKANLNCQGPDCDVYRLDPDRYPRTRQFYLSFDVDLTRLGIRNRFLRMLAGAVNIIKIPAPALEVTGKGAVRFHPVFF